MLVTEKEMEDANNAIASIKIQTETLKAIAIRLAKQAGISEAAIGKDPQEYYRFIAGFVETKEKAPTWGPDD